MAWSSTVVGCTTQKFAWLFNRSQVLPGWMARLCGALLLAVLGACGGGGDEPTAVVPARAGSADIDVAGGSVDAILEGGTQVTLIVPPGALTSKTSFRLDPQSAASGDLSTVQVTPAGLQFRTPAQLVVTLPAGSDPSNKLVSFGLGGVRVPIGAVDTVTRTMTVDLPYLGVSGAAAASLAVDASGRRATIASTRLAATETALVLFVQNGDLTSAVTLWHQLVATLASDGSRDNAIEVQEGFTALLRLSLDQASQAVKDQVAVDITTWRNVDCTQLTTAISALNSFDFSSDFAGYTQRATDVLAFGRLTQDLFSLAGQIHFIAPGACQALQGDPSAPVRPSFSKYIDAASTALQALSPVDDFDTLLNTRLRQLLNFIASLQAFGAVDDLAAQVQAVGANQTVRLRAGAYTDCRSNHSQLKQQVLLVREIGDPGFEPLSPYERSDLIADIQYCDMLLHWAVLDANDAVLQKGDAGGILPGVIVNAVPVTLTGAAKLVLSGPLSALNCPSGSNNEQLGFVAGPVNGATGSVGTLTPGNDSGYLEVSDLPIQVSQLLALVHPNGGTGNGQLVVQRTGAVCNTDFPGFTQHSVLVNFTLNFGSVAITTSSLPDATVGLGYVAQLLSVGGTAPLTWSATGLPSGLSIDAQTGLISGTPANAGTSTVEVTLNGSDGSSAQRSLTLLVKPAASRWRLVNQVTCGGPVFADMQGTFILNESGDQLSGSLSAVFPPANFGRANGCSPIEGDPVTITLTAVAQRNASGAIVALANLALTTTIDSSSTGGTVCTDIEIDVAGPIALSAQGFLASLNPTPQSQCLRTMSYNGFQLVKVP
jgi:hypothetical protein